MTARLDDAADVFGAADRRRLEILEHGSATGQPSTEDTSIHRRHLAPSRTSERIKEI
jgi:hypothetical protein